jgi:hypothetical protein
VGKAVEELTVAFKNGELTDRDDWHTLKSMLAKGLA